MFSELRGFHAVVTLLSCPTTGRVPQVRCLASRSSKSAGQLPYVAGRFRSAEANDHEGSTPHDFGAPVSSAQGRLKRPFVGEGEVLIRACAPHSIRHRRHPRRRPAVPDDSATSARLLRLPHHRRTRRRVTKLQIGRTVVGSIRMSADGSATEIVVARTPESLIVTNGPALPEELHPLAICIVRSRDPIPCTLSLGSCGSAISRQRRGLKSSVVRLIGKNQN